MLLCESCSCLSCKDVNRIFIRKLESHGFTDGLMDYFAQLQLDVGTCCTGTDGPIFALRGLADAVREGYGVDLKLDHKFSCEFDPKKRRWISRACLTLKKIFGDISKLGHASLSNTLDGRPCAVDKTYLFLAGFLWAAHLRTHNYLL